MFIVIIIKTINTANEHLYLYKCSYLKGKNNILGVYEREFFLSFPSILLNYIKSFCNFSNIPGTNWFDYNFSIEVLEEKFALSSLIQI